MSVEPLATTEGDANVITLPSHTAAALVYESGLRIHWPTQDRLQRKSFLPDQILVSVGVKQRAPDPDFYFKAVTGLTEAEVNELTDAELRRIMRDVARMKSGYERPAAGRDSMRTAVASRFSARYGARVGKDQVLYGPGGASQGLSVVIHGLFGREGVVPVDLPCWPGTPPKIRAHGPTPVGMFRVHESFEANRKRLAPFIDRGIAGVYTSFPGNPIGLRLTAERLAVLTRTRLWLRDTCLKAGKRAPIWLADEVYLDQPEETLSLLAGEDNRDVVVVYSLTKSRLQAGHRDHFIIVGNDPVLKKWLGSVAKDGLSGNVGWKYADAIEYELGNGEDFLQREREHDHAAAKALAEAVSGIEGMEIDEAVDDQYRYIHLSGIPDGLDSDDFKRFCMLEAAATGTVYVDFVPGVYFNLPSLLEPAGISINEVDGIRIILAYEPPTMLRAGRQIARQWGYWREAGFPRLPEWNELERLLDQDARPQQILEEAGYRRHSGLAVVRTGT